MRTIKHSLLIMIFCKTTFTQSIITGVGSLMMLLYINMELVNKKIPYIELIRKEKKVALPAKGRKLYHGTFQPHFSKNRLLRDLIIKLNFF